MILSRFPFPLEKGDKLRAFNQIRILSEQHDVYVFCITSKKPTTDMIQALSPYCKEICWYQPSKVEILASIIRTVWSKKPLQNALFVFKKAKRKLHEFVHKIQPNHVFCQGVRVADYAKEINIPKTLDYEDAFSLRMLRFAEQTSFPKNCVYEIAYRRLKTAEAKAFDDFDYKLIISEADREFINHSKREEILIIKNGVDLDFFKPNSSVPKTADLLFVGNLTYQPNIHAVNF